MRSINVSTYVSREEETGLQGRGEAKKIVWRAEEVIFADKEGGVSLFKGVVIR